MLEEISILLGSNTAQSPQDYVHRIVEENDLQKSTISTRRLSAQRLSELYCLETSVPIFRAMVRWWNLDPLAQPLLAMLVALARDPLLRATAPVVLTMGDGESLDRNALDEALRQHAGTRLNPNTLAKVARNTASSWMQSGHLIGRTFKKRRIVVAHPSAVAMAVLLGYLQGLRGAGLFQTLWARTLDASPEALISQANRAAGMGLMRFRSSGDAFDIAFPELLSRTEIEVSHG